MHASKANNSARSSRLTHPKTSSLWSMAGFMPFLSIAFLNAFTDLGHKIVIQNTLFKVYEGDELTFYTSLIQLMILLPFLMVFTPAGFLSDRFSKVSMIRWASFSAIPITIGILSAYYLEAFEMAFALTFALGIQSAIYSPAKYSLIRELVGKKHLAGANSAIQALTIVAILGGTAGYSFLFENWVSEGSAGEILYSVRYAGFFLVAGAMIEWLSSLRLPEVSVPRANLKFPWKKYFRGESLVENLKGSMTTPVIKQSILGLSIFWAINQVLLASFGSYFKEVTGSENTLISNGIMGVAGLGIIIGSVLAAKLSKNYIETGLLPIATLGIAASLLAVPHLTSISFLMILFGVYGVFGGLFLVPLNSLIQFHAGDDEGGRVLASNNFVQTLVMVGFLGTNLGLSVWEVSSARTFMILGAIAILGCMWTLIHLPQSMIRLVLKMIATPRYKLTVTGLDNLPHQGGVLLLGNHISWIDWAMLQLASPRPIRFVMLRSIYEKWYMKWFLDLCGVIPIAQGSSKDAIRQVSICLKKGETVALFPEGHISQNGSLSSFRSGFERAAAKTGATIVPFYLHGLWGSKYSYASEFLKEKNSLLAPRQIVVSFGPRMIDTTTAPELKKAVQHLSIHSWKASLENSSGVASSWLRTAKGNLFKKSIMDKSVELKSFQVLTGVLLFRKKLSQVIGSEQNVGFLLPPAPGALIAKLATLALGKTIVPLNYTASPETLKLCVKKAEIKTIITSELFLKKLNSRNMDMSTLWNNSDRDQQVQKIELENIKAEVKPLQKIGALIQALAFPCKIIQSLYFKGVSIDENAAILFSSGSEGTPKGVELTHENLLGNIAQVSSLLNPTKEDVVLGQLPTFHAFGLTVTSLLPLIEGIPVLTHPDPLDVKKIGKLVLKNKVTFMCGTSTFLNMYSKSSSIHPLMFSSIRMVVSGAEKLRSDVRNQFFEKYGIQILEGYGTTETTPVASVNIPDLLLGKHGQVQTGQKLGSVGIALPGSCFRVVDPGTIEELAIGEDGLILIGGTQIMKGYLDDEKRTNDVLLTLEDGTRWYKSGDKGHLDEDGFLTIVDRYSRFAKVGGEMVSLTAVESAIEVCLEQEAEVLTVAVPHQLKGEQLVALVANMNVEQLKARVSSMNQEELPKLYRPSKWLKVDDIPKLGSGKIDLAQAKRIVVEEFQ